MASNVSVGQNILPSLSGTGSRRLFWWDYGEMQAQFLFPRTLDQKQLEILKGKTTSVEREVLEKALTKESRAGMISSLAIWKEF